MKRRLLFAALHTTDVVARARAEFDALVHEGEADMTAEEVARAAAYARDAPAAERVHHLRMRMERELARERPPSRYDLKAGRGGLVDVEFAAQWLQMKNGADPRVRTTETQTALAALACRSRTMPGSARLTMLPSSTAIEMPRRMTAIAR